MWKIRFRRPGRSRIILLLLTIVMISVTYALPPSGNITPAGNFHSFSLPGGSLTQINPSTYTRAAGTATNNTMRFEVAGIESGEPTGGIVYKVNTTSTLTVVYPGAKPTILACVCSASYSGGNEILTFSSGLSLSNFVIGWTPGGKPTFLSEPQSVIFKDDFLYGNPFLESSWDVDQYFAPGTPSGEYTSSGYLFMTNAKAPSSLTEIAVHPNIVMWSPTGYSNDTIIKRKMTVALIPFDTKQANVANIHVGLTHLISATNPYPQSGSKPPFATPNTDQNSLACADSSVAQDNIGIEYMSMDTNGTAFGISCVDPSGTRTVSAFPQIYDPTKYTVFTIETFAVFCSTCSDLAFNNAFQTPSPWVFFRIYQEDQTGRIIQGSDQSFNQTAGISPLGGTQPVYAFLGLKNNGAATIKSSIDFVQIQSFGSPVCLVAPSSTLCTRLPNVPPGIIGNQGIVGLMAFIANQIGFGNEQLGAIMLFMMISFAGGFIPYFYTKSIPVGAFGEMLVLGFFVYVGFLPIWTLIIVFAGGAGLSVMIFVRILSGSSMLGGGGGDLGATD